MSGHTSPSSSPKTVARVNILSRAQGNSLMLQNACNSNNYILQVAQRTLHANAQLVTGYLEVTIG